MTYIFPDSYYKAKELTKTYMAVDMTYDQVVARIGQCDLHPSKPAFCSFCEEMEREYEYSSMLDAHINKLQREDQALLDARESNKAKENIIKSMELR